LTKCEDYLSDHWPKVLKEYESQLIAEGKTPDMDCFNTSVGIGQQRLSNLDKDVLKESEYINQIIQDAAILHIDKVRTADWNQRLGKDRIYPFQVNEDYISEGFETIDTNDVELLDSEEERAYKEDYETTDSSFIAACFNIRMIAVNESSFSLEAFMELQSDDEFCLSKIKLINQKDAKVRESGYFLKRKILMKQMQMRDLQLYSVICIH
jgi:hypothetical protein